MWVHARRPPARQHEGGFRELEYAWPQRLHACGWLTAENLGLDPIAADAHLARASLQLALGRGLQAGVGARLRQCKAHIDQLDFCLGVAVAVPPLVLGFEL